MLKSRIRRAFNRAAESYAAAAAVQRRVITTLAEQLPPIAAPRLIVDAGCGTGFAFPLLHERWPSARMLGIDIAEQMLARRPGENPAADSAARICGDLESPPLAGQCADLYWSSLTLQWCALDAALREAHRILRDGGTLAIATLTTGTFHEVRSAFAGIDAYPHVLEFLPPETIEASVAASGFLRIRSSRERIRAAYPSLKDLLQAVRRTGAHEVGGRRRPGLFGKSAWARVEAAYARFRENDECPLTYDVFYVTASK